jgi:hypothetical protein
MDSDGNISPKDLCQLDDMIVAYSKVGRELQLIKNHYVFLFQSNNGKMPANAKVSERDIEMLLPENVSCIATELIMKISAEPGAYPEESVFIPSR